MSTLPALPALPALPDQAERLIALGVADLADLAHDQLRDAARAHPSNAPDALLAIHHNRLPASVLTPLLRHRDRPGFVVVDLTDVDDFTPIPKAGVPPVDVYVVTGVDRGDDLADRTPQEALPVLVEAGRTPLTLTEGIHWLLQVPAVLERNHCFMTIGSRLRKDAHRLDSRTPAIWISNGTGRDGPTRRDAPKVGWCWAGNRHTWLGFASATQRRAPGS